MQFPNLWRYTVILAQRDQGIAMVIACVMIAVCLLAYARGWWPRLLPAVRVTGAVLFWGSFVLVVWVKVLSNG